MSNLTNTTTATTAANLTKVLTLAEAKKFFKNDKIYEAGEGQFLVNMFGKYLPNITFVISSTFEVDENERVISPLDYTSDEEVTANMNINFDGDVVFIFGDFWRSKKGGACFRPKDPMRAKHMLVCSSWGGAFSRTRGNYHGENTPGVLYFRRARSNGGGAGNDFYVVPVGYKLTRDAEGNAQEGRVQNADQIRKKHAELQREARAKRLCAYEAAKAAEAASLAARDAAMPQVEALAKRLVIAGNSNYQLKKEEAQFKIDYRVFSYTPEGVAEATKRVEEIEAFMAKIHAEAKAKAEAKAAAMPQFEALRDEAKALDWTINLDGEIVKVETGRVTSGYPAYREYREELKYDFSQGGVEALKGAIRAEQQARAEKAAEEARRQAEADAKAAGLPSDIRIWHRAGRTNAGKGWVISPGGMERECDEVDTSMHGSNSKRFHQSYEGDHVWNQILPGELVLRWSKAYTAADHVFEVIYRPEHLTEVQLERVAEIQLEIEEQWAGLTGLASGKGSPSVGDGWGLF